MTLLGASFETGMRAHLAGELLAHRTYIVFRWFWYSCLSVVSSGWLSILFGPWIVVDDLSLFLVLRLCWEGWATHPSSQIRYYSVCRFLAECGNPNFKKHRFSSIWTVCLRNASTRSLHFDWQAALWADANRKSRFVCLLSSWIGYFSRPVAMSLSVRLLPSKIDEVNFERPFVLLGCRQSEPSWALSSSGRYQVG